MNDELPPRILNPVFPETAHQLGVGRTTVYDLISAGELLTVRIGRRTLVPQTSIDAYVARLIQAAQDEITSTV